jgi:hypothetical protein
MGLPAARLVQIDLMVIASERRLSRRAQQLGDARDSYPALTG